jgi:pyruvate dehydrogenase E2 component (dihydrolipoamide acetyltransferase)
VSEPVVPQGLRLVIPGDESRAIVLVHGFGADRFSWLANQTALGGAGAVYGLDLPGHGQEPLLECSLLEIADSLARRIEAAGLQGCAIVGHSLGGAVALLLAASRPDLVRALVLIAPAGLGRGVDRSFLHALPELEGAEEAGALLRRLVSRPTLIGRPMVAGLLRHLQSGDRREALRRVSDMLVADDKLACAAAKMVRDRALPRLVIWGADDRINQPDEERLTCFGGRLEICAGAGHLPHVELAVHVNALMLAFLDSPGIGPEH